MAVATVVGYDATTGNIAALPKGALQVAGYDTGSDVAWTPEQYAAHPDALHIDQDPADSDFTADILDVEARAGTLARCSDWAHQAQAAWRAGTRPGQRWPAIYASQSNVTPVVNALLAGGIGSGVGLFIADWNLSQAQAQAAVAAGSGPFPQIGAQFRDVGNFDIDVWSVPWLRAVSGGKHLGYGPPLDLAGVGGLTSVRLQWKPPGTPGLPAPFEYEVWVYEGMTPAKDNLVHSYPRFLKETSGQWGGLSRSTLYTAHVGARGPDGTLTAPYAYASAVFRTS